MGTKVSFGMFWQVYGRQTIELPDTVDDNDADAVREYIESIWDDISLPSGEYVTGSDELDPESIQIDTPAARINARLKREKRAAFEKMLKNAKPILFNEQMVRTILNGDKTETRRRLKNKDASRPPYSPGDILYVRETWQIVDSRDAAPRYIYRASEPERENVGQKWRPSIHMPKTAARLLLRVTDVCLEKLWDITTDGIRREGLCEILDDNDARNAFAKLWDSTVPAYDADATRWVDNPYVWRIRFKKI